MTGSAGSERTADAAEAETLVAFARLYLASDLVTFTANKYRRTGVPEPIYDCWTETRAQPGGPLERFELSWAPGRQDGDPITGFRDGRDLALSAAADSGIPQDHRTAALLLLVTTKFVYLSAIRTDSGPHVRGAIEMADGTQHYVVLAPGAIAEAAGTKGG